VLAAVAIVGWTNHRTSPTAAAYTPPPYDVTQPVANQYGEYPAGQAAQPAAPDAGPVVYAASPFGDEPVVSPPPPPPAVVAAPPPPPAPVYEAPPPRRTRYVYYYDRHHHRHRRVLKYVAGGAIGGAVIGGLAGGGKGAGIGALAGGAGGYVLSKIHH